MDAKLTLKLDEHIIVEAKIYARKRNVSLSKMVEKFFKSLVEKKTTKRNYSPLVEELSGIIHLEDGYDSKEDYTSYLIEKYK